MVKKLKSIYSLGGLLIKKKSLQVIQAINILRVFSSLRFFKIDYYPFDYKKFVKFYNELVLFSMYQNYLIYFKGLYYYLIDILNNNLFLKKKFDFEIKSFLKFYKKSVVKLFNIKIINKYKNLLRHKFWFKKLKKVYYLQKTKIGNRVKKIKSREQLLEENQKMKFFSNLVRNRKNLVIIHNYLKTRYKNSFKKKILYFNKKNNNSPKNLRYKLSNDLTYQKIRKKKVLLYTKLRYDFKGKNFTEKNEEAVKFIKKLSKNKRKLKWLLKKRKKKFKFKSRLIKRFKRLIFKRKRRTGILHFRIYYSNYYVTLTDLSHNVIFSCSAGSVSDTNNKKTKMSNVVSIPIFYRILFFLRAFKIKNLKFVFRNRIDKLFFNAISFFKKKGYKIKSYSFVQKAPHHLGQRKQKPRRI